MIYRKLETRRLSIVAPPPPPLSILDNRARISFPTRGEKKEVRRKKRVFVLEGTLRSARVPGRKFLSGWISSRFEIETFSTLEKRGTLNRCESGGSRHLRLFPRLLTRIKFKRGFN